jgi:hypothetical protein
MGHKIFLEISPRLYHFGAENWLEMAVFHGFVAFVSRETPPSKRAFVSRETPGPETYPEQLLRRTPTTAWA